MTAVVVNPQPLTPAEVVDVARHGATVELAGEALTAMEASSARVQALARSEHPVYGISTGFGALATTHIPVDRRADLQRSLIRSHAASNGEPVEREVVRGLMLLRLRTLASGHTGVRPVVAQTLAALLNAGVEPAVREFGSLGCSGDLAPLAHVALTLMGEGESAEAMVAAGIAPVVLAEKEGLALINGTEGMLATLVLAGHDLSRLVTTADLAAAMSVEALLGTDRVFADDLQQLRPQPGQAISAANMRGLLAGSPIVASHRGAEDTRVQDAYSMRCAPQVAGACRDTIDHA
ncbi:MAG: histidine ammonia-lyase, partial [Frankiaceae bacterium]|nr:histidine ammonia-lyase [Frankiaceae bacterium]